jgi:ferritin-like metal-binding protein YciE
MVRDIYSSEQQAIKVLPEMYQKARGSLLRELFARSLEQTTQHIHRVEQVCEQERFTPTGTFCNGTRGIIQEAREMIEEFVDTAVGEFCLIAAAKKMEAYSINSYRALIACMESLQLDPDLIDLMRLTLRDEVETDAQLNSLAGAERGSFVPDGSNRARLL